MVPAARSSERCPQVLSVFLPFGRLRRLMLETLCVRVDVVEDGFSWRGRADAPRLGGCLARVARAFVRDRLGSALRLLADVLAALDADLKRLANFA